MNEGSWGEATSTPIIDWSASAGLENVARGGHEIAEVTSLEGAVRAWLALEPTLQEKATLTVERPVLLNEVDHSHLAGLTIAALAEHLPPERGT